VCGLAGFRQRRGGLADAAITARMLDRQQHRGPDHRGVWAARDTALGLDRLAILDLSAQGDQPFVLPDGSGALAYNGEVYNWRQLRAELTTEGVCFVSQCDTEVVLHALDRWGPARAIPRFDGMFALAWRDLRDDTLWLARDRSGIKPLYIAETPGAAVFASEIKALFAHPDVPCRPDLHALVTTVCFDRLAGDWTAFEGVCSVLPGTMLRIDETGTTETAWFDVERDIDVDRIVRAASVPFDQQVNELRRLLEASVEAHLDSDAPLAVMCSGGLDSSLTTAIAVRSRPGLVAYVAEAEGLRVSEADKAQRVTDHLGVTLRRIPITDAEFPGLWARAAWHNDDPPYFLQNPLALKVCEAVHDDGFKVLVTGEGSDELFGGYGTLAKTGRMWRRIQWHRRIWPNLGILRRLGRRLQWAMPHDLAELADDPFTPHDRRGRLSALAPLALDAGMRQAHARSLFARLAPVRSLSERAFLAHAMHDFHHHLRVVLTANDKMSMASSVEARVPFLESAVIDFGLHLDAKAKLHRGQSKRIVKAVAEGMLPREIVHAGKIGFGVPVRMFGGYEALLERGLVAEFFKWGSRGWDERARLLRPRPWPVGRLVSLELWAQLYFNGASPDSLAERMRSARSSA
jgi:asparagine synthase (glutamine-hydrolysing)